MSTIIVEGCDGSGKTRLCRHLLKGTGLPTLLISRSGPPSNAETLDSQVQWLTNLPTNLHLLCDRHPWVSELVYGPVLRGESYMTQTVEQIGNVLHQNRKGILLLYCRPAYSHMRAGIQDQDQLRGVHEKLGTLIGAYDTVLAKLKGLGARVLQYDWTHDPEYDVITKLVKEYYLYGTLGQHIQGTGDTNGAVSSDL